MPIPKSQSRADRLNRPTFKFDRAKSYVWNWAKEPTAPRVRHLRRVFLLCWKKTPDGFFVKGADLAAACLEAKIHSEILSKTTAEGYLAPAEHPRDSRVKLPQSWLTGGSKPPTADEVDDLIASFLAGGN